MGRGKFVSTYLTRKDIERLQKIEGATYYEKLKNAVWLATRYLEETQGWGTHEFLETCRKEQNLPEPDTLVITDNIEIDDEEVDI
jgi:hypothetical protein